MEWNGIVQLEETYSNHLVQLLHHFRAEVDQKLKHVIKCIVRMPLQH